MSVEQLPVVEAFEADEKSGAITLLCDDGTRVLIVDPRTTVPGMMEAVFQLERIRAQKIVVVAHPDIDIQIAETDGISASQVIRQLCSPTSETILLEELPASVKTFDDIDNGDIAEALARKLADRIFGP